MYGCLQISHHTIHVSQKRKVLFNSYTLRHKSIKINALEIPMIKIETLYSALNSFPQLMLEIGEEQIGVTYHTAQGKQRENIAQIILQYW